MNMHSRAHTTPISRGLLVQRMDAATWPAGQVAGELGVSRRTGYKWLRRHREEGAAGLLDRSSRPHRMPRLTDPDRVAVIEKLRRCRMSGPAIAHCLQMPRSTVAGVLKRANLARLRDLEPVVPPTRYERKQPGELIHIDIKKLGKVDGIGHRITGDRTSRARGVGWEFVHVCIDDASRLAYVEVLSDERYSTSIGFLQRALDFFRSHGIRVLAVMTDNGSGYRSTAFAHACAEVGLRHLFTRPYRPQTNGKAERFIQTLLREWAYALPYPSSRRRTRALPRWLHRYNHHRPHTSLNGKSPIARVRLSCE
jgi:transposase InsO family protein